MDVTDAVLDRALQFANRLIRTAEGLGWPLQLSPPPPPSKPEPRRYGWEPPAPVVKPAPVMARLLVDGVEVEFRIEERTRRVKTGAPPAIKRRNQYDRSPPPYRNEPNHA